MRDMPDKLEQLVHDMPDKLERHERRPLADGDKLERSGQRPLVGDDRRQVRL